MLTACVESFKENLEELKAILPTHWQELALNQDKVPLDPQYEVYFAHEDAGGLLFITLRNEGKLAGYFIGFIAPGLHYKTCLTLRMDIFYVHPDYRGNRGGVILFKAMENEAKRRGVHSIIVGSKCHKDASRLFEALGYNEIEKFYSKWIGE